jgi:hypothetical protein
MTQSTFAHFGVSTTQLLQRVSFVTAGVITQRFNQSINQTITAHRQGNTTP